jgi:hypothetical protein
MICGVHIAYSPASAKIRLFGGSGGGAHAIKDSKNRPSFFSKFPISMSNQILSLLAANFAELTQNPYPGRGIVLGSAKDGSWIQVYWIMGRSENSRNRIFQVNGDGSMCTQAFDESKLTDPSLIIYHPMRKTHHAHIVSNGDQTDTLYKALNRNGNFRDALSTREFEPDAPNFTPRISGVTRKDGSFTLSILKTMFPNNASGGCRRNFFEYAAPLPPGHGMMITTYKSDGDPLPSFDTEPIPVPLWNSAEETLVQYWNALNKENRVALAVKRIHPKSFEAETTIWNALQP